MITIAAARQSHDNKPDLRPSPGPSTQHTMRKRRAIGVLYPLALWALFLSFWSGEVLSQETSKEPELPLPAARTVDFRLDIEPIFAKSCLKCHGAERSEGGLRLDNRKLAIRGGDRGSAIVPGRSAKSFLVRFAAGLEADTRMPPDGEGEQLSAEQIGLLRAWIDQGATWPELDNVNESQRATFKHWSFQRLELPVRPTISRMARARNAIDQFVLSRLDKEGIDPSPSADRSTLIRRLSLDLIGLPPTPEETIEFTNDDRQDAYEQLVERLLASPHFGERWGRIWLDAARYADSDGYNGDSARPIWKYRDWVIQAFNADMPFDQFTIEQLAGDLLPQPTLDQKIATGFHRNTLLNLEGGNDDEEFRVERVVDRVNTTGTVFLGLSLGCAECHAHKYDPITQREYYQFFAFFNSADEPTIDVPTPEQALRLPPVNEAIALAETELNQYDESQTERLAEWEARQHALRAWKQVRPESVVTSSGGEVTLLSDGSVLLPPESPETESITIKLRIPPTGITGLRLDAMPDKSLANLGPGRGNLGDFELSEIQLEAQSHTGDLRQKVGIDKGVTESSRPNRTIEMAYDGDPKTGWSPDPMTGGVPRYALFGFQRQVQYEDGGYLIVKLTHASQPRASLGRVLLSVTSTLNPAKLVSPNAVNVLVVAPEQRTEAQKKSLAREFQSQDLTRKPFLDKLNELRKQKSDVPQTLVMANSSVPRKTHIHIRGNFLRKGDLVTAEVPASLPPIQALSEIPSRLDLGRWLVSRDQPLTARVTVNRFWQVLFGTGLVETENDFGTQGSPPTHPELLDWLAADFRDSGWSTKRLIYTIVTSETYRQSSGTRAELVNIDPANRLLARQSRIRLDAELVRDSAFAVSGILTTRIGGPSVFPYQPAGVMIARRSATRWVESTGDDIFRRTMYTHFWRTSPHPFLMTFDAPKADAACTRRDRSNTPVQALTLLNDPPFVECARRLASAILLGRSPNSATVDDSQLLQQVFVQCVSRTPSRDEKQILQDVLAAQRLDFRENADAAEKLVGTSLPSGASVSELAAWTAVARVLLNLDEFITRE